MNESILLVLVKSYSKSHHKKCILTLISTNNSIISVTRTVRFSRRVHCGTMHSHALIAQIYCWKVTLKQG